uniref:Uncharacterized protein n=1 Tax=Oryza brachyantha TaxID=4533 RepID=J3N8N3_ORYBR
MAKVAESRREVKLIMQAGGRNKVDLHRQDQQSKESINNVQRVGQPIASMILDATSGILHPTEIGLGGECCHQLSIPPGIPFWWGVGNDLKDWLQSDVLSWAFLKGILRASELGWV